MILILLSLCSCLFLYHSHCASYYSNIILIIINCSDIVLIMLILFLYNADIILIMLILFSLCSYNSDIIITTLITYMTQVLFYHNTHIILNCLYINMTIRAYDEIYMNIIRVIRWIVKMLYRWIYMIDAIIYVYNIVLKISQIIDWVNWVLWFLRKAGIYLVRLNWYNIYVYT